MEGNGYRVKVENVNDLTKVKRDHQVPPQLQSCHTAVVDGYVIEGHVSVSEIERCFAVILYKLDPFLFICNSIISILSVT